MAKRTEKPGGTQGANEAGGGALAEVLFATTDCIENLIGLVRHVTRKVKRWRGGAMIRRWVGLGLGRAAARFRRVKGQRDLAALATALRKGATSSEAAA